MKTRQELLLARKVVQYLNEHHIEPTPPPPAPAVEIFTDASCTQHPVDGTTYTKLYAKVGTVSYIGDFFAGTDIGWMLLVTDSDVTVSLYDGNNGMAGTGQGVVVLETEDASHTFTWSGNAFKLYLVDQAHEFVGVYEDEECTKAIESGKTYTSVYVKTENIAQYVNNFQSGSLDIGNMISVSKNNKGVPDSTYIHVWLRGGWKQSPGAGVALVEFSIANYIDGVHVANCYTNPYSGNLTSGATLQLPSNVIHTTCQAYVE